MTENNRPLSGEGAEERTELAQERTRWAAHRTILANERTFSAWLRTGFAAIVGGLAVSELLGDGTSGWLARIIGILLILSGAGISLLACWRFRHLSAELKERELPAMPAWVCTVLAFAVMLIALLVLLLLLLR